MPIATDLLALGHQLHADITDKKGTITIECVVAERKSFLSKKKLTYSIKCRPNDTTRDLDFSEIIHDAGPQ